MILLEKVTLSLNSKLINQQKKYLKISAEQFICKTISPAKQISDRLLSWSQIIKLTLAYNKIYQFEVCEKHQFGYNPEEIKNIYLGEFYLIEGQKKYTATVKNYERENVGFLNFQVKVKNGGLSNISKVDQNSSILVKSQLSQSFLEVKNQLIKIDSIVGMHLLIIVGYLPIAKQRNIQIKIKIDEKQIYTECKRSKTGQIAFIENYPIFKSKISTKMFIEVHSIDENHASQMLASGNINLLEAFQQNKVKLIDQAKQVGQIFLSLRKLHSNGNHEQTGSIVKINKDQITFRNQIAHISSSIFPRRDAEKSKSSRSSKKMSIMYKNGDRIFSKETRFKRYEDKKSQEVSYLQDRNFEFKQKRSNKFYRGASIGRGSRIDFSDSIKMNPGVGEYILPCIWDRY